MTRLLLILGTLAALAVPGVFLAAAYVDRRMSKDVTLITPFDEMIVEFNREDWKKGQPVAPLYGQVVDKPIRVVKPDPKFTVVPQEDPSLTLLKVDASYHPLQFQSVEFFAKWSALGSAAVALLCLGAWKFRSRKRLPPTVTQP